jgi:hypothetical protein
MSSIATHKRTPEDERKEEGVKKHVKAASVQSDNEDDDSVSSGRVRKETCKGCKRSTIRQ